MKNLIKQYAATVVLAEQINIRTANGEPVSIQEHALLSSTMKRLAASIGLGRQQKQVESVADYVARNYPKTEAGQ